MLRRRLITRMFRYGVVGVLANLSGYALFLLLLAFGARPVAATGATYLAVVAVSYFANRYWTFGSHATHAEDGWRFLAAHTLGFACSVGSMHVMAPVWPPAIAQMFVILIAAVVIYSSLEVLRFGRGGDGDAH